MTGNVDEAAYDALRLRQWKSGAAGGFSRRTFLALAAALSAGVVFDAEAAEAVGAGAVGPIVKPLPPELFTVFGSNAEMRWSAMRGQGYLVPVDRFFVRDHTSTPLIDADTWRLTVDGAGLRGGPVEFSLAELRRLPSETAMAAVECAGNGRSFFTTQQGQTVTGTAWKLGAVGVARWRGVRLSTVLRRAGLSGRAVDVMPSGLDPELRDRRRRPGPGPPADAGRQGPR